MTYEEFFQHVQDSYNALSEPKQYRLGQLYFNKLFKHNPNVANELRGTMIDPFYKERITQVVHDFVSERW